MADRGRPLPFDKCLGFFKQSCTVVADLTAPQADIPQKTVVEAQEFADHQPALASSLNGLDKAAKELDHVDLNCSNILEYTNNCHERQEE